MTNFSCWCNCKCWGDCYTDDFIEDDDICGECECHGTGLEESEEVNGDGESVD